MRARRVAPIAWSSSIRSAANLEVGPRLYHQQDPLGVPFGGQDLVDSHAHIASSLQDFIGLHHAGGESKRGRNAAAATGLRVITFDVCQAMRVAYGTTRARAEGDATISMSMDFLAPCAGTVQQHGSDEDCISQTEVWRLLVGALYRHLHKQ